MLLLDLYFGLAGSAGGAAVAVTGECVGGEVAFSVNLDFDELETPSNVCRT